MEEILAKCGNRCDLCANYYKNIEKFGEQKIREGWLKYLSPMPDDIKCVGCLTEGNHPRENCLIKNCANEKNLETCGHCLDLVSHNEFCFLLKNDMDIKEKALKEHDTISKEDYDIFFKAFENEQILMKIHEKRSK